MLIIVFRMFVYMNVCMFYFIPSMLLISSCVDMFF